jgi:hypothetical protein
MPVYLFTVHAYRSWSEGNANGFIQHGDGLQAPNPALAEWRDDHASHEPARFDLADQDILHEILQVICKEKSCKLHAGATTLTHVHGLVSFTAPLCDCKGAEWCRRDCAVRICVEKCIIRLKQKMGQAMAKKHETNGRPYFSRGWDLTPIRRMPHFQYHIQTYLPKHDKEGGIFRRYK